MIELVCIGCPKGCRLKVNEENSFRVSGASCERGIAYGKTEVTNPTRIVTSTVKIVNAIHRRLPVKTDRPIPKTLVSKAVGLLENVDVSSPIRLGDIVYRNILGTGANFVAERDM